MPPRPPLASGTLKHNSATGIEGIFMQGVKESNGLFT